MISDTSGYASFGSTSQNRSRPVLMPTRHSFHIINSGHSGLSQKRGQLHLSNVRPVSVQKNYLRDMNENAQRGSLPAGRSGRPSVLQLMLARNISKTRKHLKAYALPLALGLLIMPHLSLPVFLLFRASGLFFLGYGTVTATRGAIHLLKAIVRMKMRKYLPQRLDGEEAGTGAPTRELPEQEAPSPEAPVLGEDPPTINNETASPSAPVEESRIPQKPERPATPTAPVAEGVASPLAESGSGTNTAGNRAPLKWNTPTPQVQEAPALAQSAESLAKKKVFDTPSHPTQRAPQVVSGPASEGQTGAGFYRDVLKMVATVKQPALAQMVAKTALERGGAPSDPASLSFQRVLAEIASGPANMQHAQRSARQLLAAHADGPAAAGGPARSKSQAAVAGVQTRTVSAPARSGESLGGL